uniref:Ketoacyl_synth_N domain-containing protein n=1 Tax=Ascaris lumbricoides TaxID=6252 RepID=A0A0M3IGI6_ASCLU
MLKHDEPFYPLSRPKYRETGFLHHFASLMGREGRTIDELFSAKGMGVCDVRGAGILGMGDFGEFKALLALCSDCFGFGQALEVEIHGLGKPRACNVQTYYEMT